MNLWQDPRLLKNWWRVLLGIFCFTYCFYILLAGMPRSIEDIPELTKYINITAGISMCAGKWIFVHLKHAELMPLIQTFNQENLRLRQRAIKDKGIHSIRNANYVLEMSLFLLSIVANTTFVVSIYIDSLTHHETVIEAVSPVYIPLASGNYPVIFVSQFFVCLFVSAAMNSSNILIGNLYLQISHHLEVLRYDLISLDQQETGVTEKGMIAAFIRLATDYQNIVRLHKQCNLCMRSIFITDVIASLIAVVFSCVEIGIVVNYDVMACFRPMFYCLFIYGLLFYWTWMGTRIADKVV